MKLKDRFRTSDTGVKKQRDREKGREQRPWREGKEEKRSSDQCTLV